MKIKSLIALILMAGNAVALAQTNPPAATWVAQAQPTTPFANIDAAKLGPPISPYVYGQFLEHIGSLIYSSLWSEILDDRKFYYAVAPKSSDDPNASQGGFGGFGPGRRNVGPGRWNPIARLIPSSWTPTIHSLAITHP